MYTVLQVNPKQRFASKSWNVKSVRATGKIRKRNCEVSCCNSDSKKKSMPRTLNQVNKNEGVKILWNNVE